MHLATFTWQDGVTAEQVEEVSSALSKLPGHIPQIRGYHYGPDLGLRAGNADYGVCALVDTEDDVSAYLDDPEHVRVVQQVIAPIRAQRLAVQVRVPDGFTLAAPG